MENCFTHVRTPLLLVEIGLVEIGLVEIGLVEIGLVNTEVAGINVVQIPSPWAIVAKR